MTKYQIIYTMNTEHSHKYYRAKHTKCSEDHCHTVTNDAIEMEITFDDAMMLRMNLLFETQILCGDERSVCQSIFFVEFKNVNLAQIHQNHKCKWNFKFAYHFRIYFQFYQMDTGTASFSHCYRIYRLSHNPKGMAHCNHMKRHKRRMKERKNEKCC